MCYQGTKIFNLGTGGGASVLEVIKAFEKASGHPIPYELAARRPGDVPSSYATCDLAEKELGWKAKLTLYDMCKLMRLSALKEVFSVTTLSLTGKDMWTWQSKNPQGYNRTSI